MTHPLFSETESPQLRLVGRGPKGSVTLRFDGAKAGTSAGAEAAASHRGQTERGGGLVSTDPRWVLAVRTQQVLQGAVLRPADRQDLLRVGRLMGLNPFDANLVIAIVQDQARRGGSLQAAATSLQRVPLRANREQSPVAWRVLRWSLAIIAAELLLVWAII